MVAGRYFDDLASVFADKVSDQREVNQNVYHAKKCRTSNHKESTCNNVSQSTARYSTHRCSESEGRRKPTLSRKSDRGKLAGMYDIEKLTEDINSSFRGKLGAYAVTSAMITTDGLFYKFVLEDVGTDKTWRPATVDDIKAEKYIIKLQEGLEVNLSERAHIAVWGRTGSKKTTVLFGIILQLFSMGADVRFIDGKDEFSSFKGFYPADKIVSDVDPVFEQLEDILAIIKERQQIMADEVQKRQKIGLKASEIGLQPVVLVADEIGSIVALMDSKQSKKFVADLTAIIQRGRSVGVSVIASTQDPSTDTLPQKIRQQFATKVLLGSANSDIQRMAFGEVATAGNVEDFRGFYTCDGLTNQPMKFYVCDLYSHGFNELGAFEKAYKIGFLIIASSHN